MSNDVHYQPYDSAGNKFGKLSPDNTPSGEEASNPNCFCPGGGLRAADCKAHWPDKATSPKPLPNPGDENEPEVSLCRACWCMTHDIQSDAKGDEVYCGKCGKLKASTNTQTTEKLITRQHVEENKSIGWYVDGDIVKQRIDILKGTERVVGKLASQTQATGGDTDRNGNPDVTAVLRIIDQEHSRYKVAVAIAALLAQERAKAEQDSKVATHRPIERDWPCTCGETHR